jgi:hypothetical protein
VQKYDDHNPTIETALELLKRAIENIESGKKYNQNGLAYEDYMTHGLQTAVDRCIEPLGRIIADRSFSQASDHIAYVALGTAYGFAGCPPSKIKVPLQAGSAIKLTAKELNRVLSSEAPHDFVSKLSGDVN